MNKNGHGARGSAPRESFPRRGARRDDEGEGCEVRPGEAYVRVRSLRCSTLPLVHPSIDRGVNGAAIEASIAWLTSLRDAHHERPKPQPVLSLPDGSQDVRTVSSTRMLIPASSRWLWPTRPDFAGAGVCAAKTAAASFATTVPSKKLGFCLPQSRTAFANTKSRKLSSVMWPSSTSS